MESNNILQSKFFQLGNSPLSVEKLEWYCRYWWVIQPEFTLGLNQLLSKTSEKILMSLTLGTYSEEREEFWKQIFKWQAPAIIDEMGFGRDPYGLMHHDLFIEQVVATTRLTKTSLIASQIRTEINSALADQIRQSFNSVETGLCMMYVVETMAPDLFRVQKQIFLAAGAHIENLKHSSLHESLEQSHADEAEKYILALKKVVSGGWARMYINKYSDLWFKFLEEVYENLAA